MPFVLIGLAVLGAAGVVALLVQSSEAKAGRPGGPELGATERGAGDPAATTTADFQTTSAAEPTDSTFEAKANELPDRFLASPAATVAPIGYNRPEDPFIEMDAIPAASRALGYAVDDFAAPAFTSSPFMDDIELPADVAFAPGNFAGGLVDPLLK